MLRFLRLLLAFAILLPANLSAAPQRPPEDCVVCGHVCCCPEMCAPLIAEKKARENSRRLSACAEAAASCRPKPTEHAALTEKMTVAAPLPAMVTLQTIPADIPNRLFFTDSCLPFLSHCPAPLTPPPRLAA